MTEYPNGVMIVYQDGVRKGWISKFEDQLKTELPQASLYQHSIPQEWEGEVSTIAHQLLDNKSITNLIVLLPSNPRTEWMVPFLRELCQTVKQPDCKHFADTTYPFWPRQKSLT